MKKLYLLILGLFMMNLSFGQLTGTKTIPGDYASIAAAITALNTAGVGAGGVTFNISAGYTETLTARLDMTATGTAANPVVFQKSGSGANPVITSYTGTALAGSAAPDGMWSMTGSDYVTIDGIDLQEAAGNTTPTTCMEYGYGLFKASGTDGANNNTIKNCTITLNRVNNTTGAGPYFQGSVGIDVMDCTPTTGTAYIAITSVAGSSSNNKFYTNTIQNCNCCIAMTGNAVASPYTLADQNNDIGGSSLLTGNNFLNFGGGAGATNPASGVFVKDQWGFNISYNTVNNNNGSGVNHPNINRGIWANLSSTGASATISHNTITMIGGGTTTQISCIENGAGASGSGNTINITDNLITNCTNATNTTGVWYGIWNNGASATNLNIQNNTFSANQTNSTSGTVYLIYNSGAVPGTVNITNNNLSQAFIGGTAFSGTMYCIYNSTGTLATTLNITNNDFSNITFATTSSGSIYFMYNLNSSANLNISSNTWTNLTLNHSGSEYFTYNSSSTQASLNFSNNHIVTGLTRTGAAGTMYIYYCPSSSLGTCIQTYNGNNWSNITATTAGSGTVYLFYSFDGSSSPYPRKTISNNVYNNITYNTTGTTYSFYMSYLGDGSTTTGSSLYNNTVSNITTAGTIYCMYLSSTLSPSYAPKVYNNNIFNNKSTGTSYSIYGTYLVGGGVGLNYYNNNIYNLQTNGTSTAAYGIYISGAVATNIYNNFISDIKAPNSTLTAPAPSISGLYVSGGTAVNAFYNSIMLNGTSVGANFGSAAIYANTTPTFTMKDNILVNNSTPNGTGKAIAYQRSSTTLTTYGATSNNNCFYAGTPGASNLIYYDGTNASQTINDFKSLASPRDANSFGENPPFLNASTAPYDLHLNPAIGTQCESGGAPVTTPVNITTDFDGDIRSTTLPDIGADEFNGIAVDLSAPNIVYTALANTNTTTPRTLITTIVDATGVPTSGIGLPVLYWKINAGSWNNVQASYLGTNQYSFTFGSGVTGGDVVSYYIVAQDIVSPTPNIGANPGGGASGYTANPPACSTPPTTPNSYTILAGISGIFYVGATQTPPNYTTLTNAVNDLNIKYMNGPVTFILMDATYPTETFPIIINNNPGSSAVNTLTIKPNTGVDANIAGSSASSIIKVNGAQYVIIDGSNNGSTTQNLTITNTATTGSISSVWFSSLGTGQGCSNCTLKNCNLTTGLNTLTTSYCLFIGGSTVGGAGLDNNNLTIQNNSISTCYYGIYVYGGSGGIGAANNLQISNNLIGSATSSKYVLFKGIYLIGITASTISGNEVYNMISTLSTNIAAIETSNDVTYTTISANKIHAIYESSTSGWGAYGISIASATNFNNCTIVNNLIYDIMTENYAISTTYNAFGIRFASGGGVNTKVYFNTVNLYGQPTIGTTATLSACFLVVSNFVGLDLRDNIFVNTMTSAYSTAKSYAIYVPSGFVFTNSDYNDYFVSGNVGVLGYYGADQATLAGWKTASGQDANSISGDPQFVSNTDPRPNLGSPVLGGGITIPGITTDYSGATRNNPPSMGAYEVGVDVSGPIITTTPLLNTTSTSVRTLTANISDYQGVPTTGAGLPVLYWKINTGAWTSTQGVYISGTQYQFTFGAGVSVYDVVSYYIAAQDNDVPTNLVSALPSAGAAGPSTNPPAFSTPPTTPYTYSILGSISGVFYVGATQTPPNYTTLTNACNDLNSKIMSGPVTFILTDASYPTETFPIVINSNPGSSATNIFTLKPNTGVDATIAGSSTSSIIKVNGAQYITIDGSNNGSTTQNLTFTNTSTSGSIAAIWVASLGTGLGSTNCTIKNCILTTGSNTISTSYGLFAGGTSIGTAGDNNNSLTIQNNNISTAYIGIYAYATSAAGQNNNLQIIGNSIGSATSNKYIGHDGIMVQYASNALISQNTIFNIITSATTPVGLTLGTGILSSTINGNNINNVTYTGTGGYGGRGMYISTGSASCNLTFVNNIIYQIMGDGYSSFSNSSPVGMYFDGTNGGLNIWFNSIYMDGNLTYSTTTQTTAILFYTTTNTNIDLRDNIFMNDLNNSVNTGAKNYAIYSAAPAASFTQINYNDYFVSGTQGVLGYLGADIAGLAAWRAATGADLNSISADPLFISTTNLQPNLGSPVLGGGTTIAGVTTDYLGTTRNSPPSIGAYEVGADLLGPTIVLTPFGNTTSTSARILTATITDFQGVPTTGIGLPVVYWKINAGTWTSTQAVSMGSGQYQFTFGGGVSLSDVVSYYIAAQDNDVPINLVSAFPSAGASGGTINPPAFSTPPATPLTYTILPPISGDVTVGTGGTYPSLTGVGGLFAAINGSVLTGNMTASIISDLSEDGTNPLYQWGETGVGGYTLTIKPVDNTIRTISNDPGLTNSMIRFDGADNVIVDGRFGGGGKYLSFTSTNVSNPIFLFIDDASNNTLTYLDINSANANAASNGVVTTTGLIPGAIAFGTTTGTNGNDNNMVSYCDIHSSTPSLGVGIYAGNGTSAGLPSNNDNNTIDHCNIYDIFLAGSASAAVDISLGNNNWSITNNSVYQTATRTYTSTQTVRGFWVTPNTGSLTSASGFIITGNYIGGTAPQCGGTALTVTGSTAYNWWAMDISVGLGAATSIQGNTIANINITTANSSSAAMLGINIANGITNTGTITGNVIGSAASNSSPYSITFKTTVSLGGLIAIRCSAGGAHNMSNNIIAGIEMIGDAATIATSFNGINYSGGSSCIINNNTVGSPTLANSIYISSTSATSTSSGAATRGIISNVSAANSTITNNIIANITSNYSATGSYSNTLVGIAVQTGAANVTGNIIRNLSSASQSTTGGGTCPVEGIAYTSTTSPAVISGNQINTLKLTNATTTAAVQVAALFFSGPSSGTNEISKNVIYGICILSPTNSAGYMTGMDLGGGTVTAHNNILRLGMDETGADLIAPCTVRGITKNACTLNAYYNDIYIGGANVGNSTTTTFAFVVTGTTVSEIRNNIFVNNRSNASTGGKHYAVNISSMTSLTINNNDYFVNGTGGVLGAVVSVDDLTLAALQTATGQDAASFNTNPNFTNVMASPPNMIPTDGSYLAGVNIPAVTVDILNHTRSNPPAIGAYDGVLRFLVSGGGSYCPNGTGATVNLSNSQTGVNYQLKKDGNPIGTPLAGTGSPLAFTNITSGTGTYTVTATNAYSSTLNMSASASVIQNPPATPPVSGGDQIGTFGGSIPNLTVTTSGTAKWYSDAALTTLVYTGLSFATGQTAIGIYTYWVTNTDANGCVSSAITVTLTIQAGSGPPPPVSLGNQTACFGGVIPNLAVTATGTAKWYTDAALTNLVYTGLSYATGMTAVGVYTYYVTNTVGSNTSTSITVSLTILALPSAPVSGGNQSACVGGTIPSLSVTATGTAKWYSDIALTTLVYTGTTFATGQTAVGTYNYYVTNTNASGCVSAATTVTLTIHALPSAPVSGGNQTACFGGTIPNLTVTATGTAKWYSDITLTTLVYTGTSFATGQTAVGVYTYYVTNTDGFGCASTAVTITLTIQAPPAAPVSGGNLTACVGGTIPNLTVTATGTAKWYSDITLTTLVFTGTSFATGQTAAGVYTYYVTNTNGSGCVSSATTISLTIQAPPAAPVSGGNQNACVGGTIPNLTVTATGTAKWYSDITLTTLVYTGTSFATGQTAVGVYNYYVTNTSAAGCVSAATTVTLTIHALPSAPVSGGNQSTCFGSAVPALSVTASGTIKWYVDAGLTLLVNTGATFNTGITDVGVYTFYVTNTDGFGCSSAATIVTLTIHALPAAPVSGGDQAITFGSPTPNLTVTATGTAKWYSDAALTTLVYTGLSFATGQTAVGVYHYYVTNTDAFGCTSSSTMVTLTILTPSIPPVSGGDQTACVGGVIPNLTVTASGTAKWYSDIALTNLVYTGLSYATGQTAVGVYHYYVTNTDILGYVSPSITVTLTIYALPASPTSGGNLSGCVGGLIPSLSVTATGTAKWYSDIALTTLVHTGPAFATGQTAVGVYTYYVTNTSVQGCVSAATTVTLTIHALPAPPVSGGNQSACYGSSIPPLTASGSGTIIWYSDPSLSTQVHVGSPFTTGFTSVGVYTYYATNQDGFGCSSSSIMITLTIHALPPAPVSGGNQVGVLGSSIPDLGVTATGTANWYSDAGLTTLVHTGPTFATGQTAVGVYTYYVTNTDAFGCVSAPTVVVLTIISSSVPPVSLGDQFSCSGSPVPSLGVTATGTVKWYTDITLTNLVHTGLTYATGMTAVGTYTYYVTNTDIYGYVSTPTIVQLTIYSLPTVTWTTGLTGQCVSATSYTLTGGTPATGVYSGPGVSGGVFNASAAGVGTKTLTYTYTDLHTCMSSATNSIQVNPLPVPVIGGPASTCLNASGNMYTAQAGMTNYLWTVPASGTITAGGTTNSNTVTVTWTSTGNQSLSVNFTNTNGCTAASATTFTTTVNPIIYAGLSGPGTACVNSTGNLYITEPGMSNYNWNVSAGGMITGGGTSGSNTVTVKWTASGPQTVSVSYLNANPCASPAPAVMNVNVLPLPVPVITGNTDICVESAYTYTTESGMTNYNWSLSPGGFISSGGTSADNTVTVIYWAAGNNTVSVNYTNASGCTAANASQFAFVSHAQPLPTLSGPAQLCNNTIGIYTTEAGMSDYIWNIPSGAVVQSGGSSSDNILKLLWNTSGSHVISVSYSNANGCSAASPAEMTVIISPTLVVNAGGNVSVVSGSSVQLNGMATGGTAPYFYNWVPATGLSDPAINNPIATPAVTTLYTLQVTDNQGCSGSDYATVTVLPANTSISGTITYLNTASSPMNNTKVYLKTLAGVILDSTMTNAIGQYNFSNPSPGTYKITAKTSKAWGGVNSTDALLAMEHFTHIALLTGLPLVAGDASGDGGVNSVDALMISQRYIGQLTSFPVGDWVFDGGQVTVTNVPVVHNFNALCAGDINGSYNVPGSRVVPTVELSYNGQMDIKSSGSFSLPVHLDGSLKVGAVSLALTYPADLLSIEGVEMSDHSFVHYSANNGDLRISWYSLNPMSLNHENLLTIRMKAKNLSGVVHSGLDLVLDGSSELADENAGVIRYVNLSCPKLVTTANQLSLSNHPNPFDQSTNIEYNLPEAATVTMSIINAIGEVISVPVNAVNQDAGAYQVNYSDARLVPGIYLCKIEVNGTSGKSVITRRLVVIKK